MNRLFRVLADVSDILDAQSRSWALVGGLAVSARTEPRFTRDLDLVVSVTTDEGAEALVRSFLGDGHTVLSTVEQDATGRLATVRLQPPGEVGDGVVVDLLFASSGIEPEIAAAAERCDLVEGLVVPIARIGHLIAQKVLSRDDDTRPQDIADLRALLAEATPPDLSQAREALLLIRDRGFSRQRDVLAEYERLLSR